MTDGENASQSDDGIVPEADPSVWLSRAAQYSNKHQAINELLDNPLKGLGDLLRELHMWITIDGERDIFQVTDDGVGAAATEEKFKEIISLGQSEQEGDISLYGEGLKGGAFYLADTVRIVAREDSNETPMGIEMTRSDFQGDEKPRFDLDPAEKILEGPTDFPDGSFFTVELSDLRVDIHDKKTQEDIKEHIGTTYEKYIAEPDELPQARSEDVTIELNGDVIEPQTDFSFGYPTWDELHPRTYQDLTIDRRERAQVNGKVEASLTVGLLKEGDKSLCGLHLYMEDRKIIDGELGERGGFRGGDYLTNLNPSTQKRLVIIANLNAIDSPGDLPWGPNKSDLIVEHPITDALHKLMYRFGRAYQYYKYGVYPVQFYEPFPEEAPYTKSREMISVGPQGKNKEYPGDHPGSSRVWRYPQSDKAKIISRLHARLGVAAPELFQSDGEKLTYLGVSDDGSGPSYEESLTDFSFLNNDFEGLLTRKIGKINSEFDPDDITVIESVPEEELVREHKQASAISDVWSNSVISVSEVEDYEKRIKKQFAEWHAEAILHAAIGIRPEEDIIPEWQKPRYNLYYPEDGPDTVEVTLYPELELLLPNGKNAEDFLPDGRQTDDSVRNEEELRRIGNKIRKQVIDEAHNHAQPEIEQTYTDQPEWRLNLYRHAQREVDGVDFDDLEETTDKPVIDGDEEHTPTEDAPEAPESEQTTNGFDQKQSGIDGAAEQNEDNKSTSSAGSTTSGQVDNGTSDLTQSQTNPSQNALAGGSQRDGQDSGLPSTVELEEEIKEMLKEEYGCSTQEELNQKVNELMRKIREITA